MRPPETRDMQQKLAQLGGGAHALATQILGNADDAADAVQDAFTTVLSAPESYDARKGPLRPWFMRVVRNRCLDMLRRRKPGDDSTELVHDPAPGPEQSLRQEQRSSVIRHAISVLPAGQREIIVLRDYMDLSYSEIADVLDILPGTVMSRLHRARLALKEALEIYGK
jgi:RNA polymerase sigma-70 factor (ECF subfamily)